MIKGQPVPLVRTIGTDINGNPIDNVFTTDDLKQLIVDAMTEYNDSKNTILEPRIKPTPKAKK